MRLEFPNRLVTHDIYIRFVTVHRRIKSGGKPAADRLIRPIEPGGRRAGFLRYLLENPEGCAVDSIMSALSISRSPGT
jgi:hypothetical protein